MKIGFIAAALFCGLAVPVTGAAESIDYLFSIRFGLAKIGEMRVSGSESGGRYSTDGRLYTSGLAGAVYDLKYVYSAAGRAANHWSLVPDNYKSKSHESGRDTTTNIIFSGGVISDVQRTPAKPMPDSARGQTGAVDPMTLIYLMLRPVPPENVCGGQYKLFDGAYFFTVHFVNARKYNDGRIVCDITYDSDKGKSNVALSGLTYRPSADGLLYIDTFTVESVIGTLKAVRK